MGLWLVAINLKSQCYGASEITDQSEATPGFIQSLTEKERDCFVWKFSLLTTMYRLAYTNETKHQKLDYIRYGSSYKDYHNINIYEDFPPETAKKIMDMIIEKEGGHCSKKVLYGIQRCTFDPNPHKRPPSARGGGTHAIDTIYSVEIRDAMDFEYFTKSMNLPINKKLVPQYGHLLKRHIYEYPHTNKYIGLTGLSCRSHCIRNNRFDFSYFDSFGICMIAKHEKYLKENDLFYFDYYLDGISTNPFATLNIPSLKNFVQRSNEIAEEYRNKSNLP